MPGPDDLDAPPPEVPEEFAAAYRDAYRRALESEDPAAALPEVPPHEVVLVGTHRSDETDTEREPVLTRWRVSRWFLPSILAAAAVALVLVAYAAGTALSGDDDPAEVAQPGTTEPTGRSGDPADSPSRSSDVPDDERTPLTLGAISADCTAQPSRDAAGTRVTYVPGNAIDGDPETAWRCGGTAVGEILTVRLPDEVEVVAVGLVPGYAKTDPESGVDRYAENNRVTRVRWTFGDGASIVQRLDPDPSSREVQVLPVPATVTDTVTLEILAVRRGPRNTTAISEVAVLGASS